MPPKASICAYAPHLAVQALSPSLVIFIGLQASGKSSFYRAYLETHHELLSKDLLRNNKRPQRRILQLLKQALEHERALVIDNTNPTPKDRAPLIALARQYKAPVTGYYFHSKLSACLLHNQQRTGRARVPDVALYTTTRLLQRPQLNEGFDQLFYVRWDDQGGFLIDDFIEEDTSPQAAEKATLGE